MYCGTKILITDEKDGNSESLLRNHISNLKRLMTSYFDEWDARHALETACKIADAGGADADVWYVKALSEIDLSNTPLKYNEQA
jgi:hypothetical protein